MELAGQLKPKPGMEFLYFLSVAAAPLFLQMQETFTPHTPGRRHYSRLPGQRRHPDGDPLGFPHKDNVCAIN